MRNRWLKGGKFKIGDLVYWNRVLFADSDWDIVMKLYGKYPMKIIKIHPNEKYNIEVLTGGVFSEVLESKAIRKVASGFIAKR